MNGYLSLSKLGMLILESAESVLEFVENEIEKEKPDFIIHLKFGLWAKLLSIKYNIPAVSLVTGFVLNNKYLLNEVDKPFNKSVELNSILTTRHLYQKAQALYQKFNLTTIDNTELFVNEEKLNIVLCFKEFQPSAHLFGNEYKYIGLPLENSDKKKSCDIIYISLGTTFNDDKFFFDLCINALSDIGDDIVISVGNKLSKLMFGSVPNSIKIVAYANQLEILKNCKLFITHGGANSVHEAIYYTTPMIVIPQTLEHEVFAKRSAEFGLGIYLKRETLTTDILKNTISYILRDKQLFIDNLFKFKKRTFISNSTNIAVNTILDFLNKECNKKVSL